MNYNNILEQLTTDCSFQKIFEDTQIPEGSNYPEPRKKIAHIRADHDGYRWWYTYWPCHEELATAEAKYEAASVYNALIADDALSDLATMKRFCRAFPDASVNGADDEFNFYLTGDICNYWLRLITRKGDYNMYLNFYARDPMEKYFHYLEHLRETGATNMYGAARYLQEEFFELRFDATKANEILLAWMKIYEEDDA